MAVNIACDAAGYLSHSTSSIWLTSFLRGSTRPLVSMTPPLICQPPQMCHPPDMSPSWRPPPLSHAQCSAANLSAFVAKSPVAYFFPFQQFCLDLASFTLTRHFERICKGADTSRTHVTQVTTGSAQLNGLLCGIRACGTVGVSGLSDDCVLVV